MPEIADVAVHFDDITTVDGYSGAFAFMGQFNTHDETSINGSTERKRSMSVKPGTVLPGRRVIEVFDERWIIGDGNTDGIYDRAIRKAYWLKRSDELATVYTPLGLLNLTAGVQMYVNKMYLKDTVNGVTDSAYDPFWEVYTSLSETVRKGYYITTGDSILRVRTSHKELSGFICAQCDEMDLGMDTLTVPGTSVYDPINDVDVTTPAVTVPALTFDAYKLYTYSSTFDPKVNSGDLTSVVGTKIAVGTVVESANYGTFRVHAVQREQDAWAHHLVKT